MRYCNISAMSPILPDMLPIQPLKPIALLALTGIAVLSAHTDGDETPLEKEMASMNQPYRSLSKAFRTAPDAGNHAEYLAMAERMLKHAKASVNYVPVRAQKLDAAAQAEMVASYKEAMQESIMTLEQLIVALKAEDYVKAKELLSTLKKQKSDGHRRFQDDEE